MTKPLSSSHTGKETLLQGSDKTQLQRRQRWGKTFQYLTLIPVILALMLIVVLIGDVYFDTWTFQVIKPKESGQTFALGSVRGWHGVVEQELRARGESEEEIAAFFKDSEEVRKFKARNRVELVYVPRMMADRSGGSGWRWVVSNNRDKLEESYGFFEGREMLGEIKEGLSEDQRLYLNPWLDFSFFVRNNSGSSFLAGLITAVLGSLWVVVLVLLISVPIGVGAAIYLEEYAPKNWFSNFLEINLRNLAGVPSIVYGILGLYAFVRIAQLGPSILSAALTLSLLILPVVVIAAREAIRSVPDSLRQASYGLGATKWQTVSQIILPNAVSGIMTGVVLSVARAIGETAPLLLVGGAGFITTLPNSPLSQYAVMPTQIYSWLNAPETSFDHAAAAGIIALLMVLSLIYVLAFYIRRRFETKW